VGARAPATSLLTETSLVTRLVRSAVFWAVPLLIIVALALTWLYRAQTYRFFDEPLEASVTAIIAAAEFKDGALQLSREPTDDDYGRALSGRYWIVGDLEPTGIIKPYLTSRSLYESTLTLPPGETLGLLADTGSELRTGTSGPDGEPLRVIARTVILPDMPNAVIIAAAADVREAAQDVRRFGAIATFLTALLASGLILAIFVQVRLGLKPLFEMGERVAAVREGTALSVEGNFPREIQPLATELNGLISHNKTVVERARTHVGNLAHALKTPIAVLRNEVEGQGDLSRDLIARQTEEMNRQVEHHLRRAQAAARGQLVGQAADADEALAALARTLTRIYGRDGKTITTDFPDDLVFRGEKRDFDEMVGNLLDNACKWAASTVHVRAFMAEENLLEVVVSDDGPGIPSQKHEDALKRGIRLDEQTPGTGLGLSIVDDLANAYGGELILGTSEQGGLACRLRLPGRSGQPPAGLKNNA
jgi:signal transduction histidine kinase